MKLSKKILFGILPITVAGTIVPAAVSCGTSVIEIEYGSVVNCLNKNDRKDFQDLKVIRKSIQNYVNVANPQTYSYNAEGFAYVWQWGGSTYDPAQIDYGKKQIYYDLIASRVLNGTPIDLTWFDKDGNINIQYQETGKNKTHYDGFYYGRNKDNPNRLTIIGYTDQIEEELCYSWTYKDCNIID